MDTSIENKKNQEPSLNTTRRLLQDKGDFIMHVGDLSYAEGYGASVSELTSQVILRFDVDVCCHCCCCCCCYCCCFDSGKSFSTKMGLL